ncbi:tyrosine recombinase XerC, partial [bacterium]|nr:tyrosine recombinase XerC [bacterium]
EFMQETDIKSLDQIDKNVIRSFLEKLNTSGISNKSLRRKLSCLRTFFKYIRREHLIEKNPTYAIPMPKFHKKVPKFLTINQIFDALDGIKSDNPLDIRNKTILELFYLTGIRLRELVSIDIGDISFNKLQVKVRGKGAKDRIVPFGMSGKKVLGDYIAVRGTLLSGKASADEDALFLSKNGKRISPRDVQRIIEKILMPFIGGERMSPHKLRHTFATHLMDEGADLRALKELLGHESLSSTQVYSHVSVEKLKDSYRKAHPRA